MTSQTITTVSELGDIEASETVQTQLAVIGAGPGGYAAAFMAADLGTQVTLIDVEPNPGGTCLYRGCISSKALLHVAKLITDAREARAYGLTFQDPDIDLDRVRASVNLVIKHLTGGLGQLSKARKIHYIQGRASFTDSQTLLVVNDDGDERIVAFDKCIIASGSRPAIPDEFLIDSPRLMTSTTALELPDIPTTLLVIGGGYIGLEIGSIYATFGSKVTFVEMAGDVLPGADDDLVHFLKVRMDHLAHRVILNARVTEMSEHDHAIQAVIQGEGIQDKQEFEKILVAVGRRPNSSGLGLAATAVTVDQSGFIVVDEQRRTTDPNIYAIGDITGFPMLAHKATHEGRTVAEVIAGRNAEFRPRAIPAVVYTDPEIAWCGLTEMEANRQGLPVKVAKFPWIASGRAATIHRNDGLTKIIADPDTDQVLGVGIVGTNAGELIAEGALAIEMGALASDIELTIHAHPTLSETIMESAETIFGHSTHTLQHANIRKQSQV